MIIRWESNQPPVLPPFPPPRRSKVEISFCKGPFRVQTLIHMADVEESLRLRHEIFHREHHGRILATGMDVDELDYVCDHLGIFDTRTERLIGSYRLTSTLFSNTFYAQRRFQMARFLALPGPKLELGRACVDPEFRNGAVLQLLWRGIIEYLRATDTHYLFGSASVRTTNRQQIARLFWFLRRNGYHEQSYPITTLEPHRALTDEQCRHESPDCDDRMTRDLIPGLFQSYLRAGAKVCAEPAVDPYLGSADFLTVLPVHAMSARFERRYATSTT